MLFYRLRIEPRSSSDEIREHRRAHPRAGQSGLGAGQRQHLRGQAAGRSLGLVDLKGKAPIEVIEFHGLK